MNIKAACNPEYLAFAKQFVICHKTLSGNALDGWPRLTVDDKHVLYYHPELKVECSNNANNRIIGIGLFLDPYAPGANTSSIVERLASQATSFDILEKLTATLSGRWVLCATCNGETRIYPDAAAQKPVFHWRGASLFIASQPALLDHLGVVEYQDDLARQFEAGNHSGSWPVGVIPYAQVDQLKPNHYLRLDNGAVSRFWPTHPLEPRPRLAAAKEMCQLLQGAVSSALGTQGCAMSLTGGYDSRLVLACAEKHWPDIEFFTVVRHGTPHHDLSIPKALARRFGLEHSFVKADRPAESGLMSRLADNVGGMYLDQSRQITQSLRQIVGDRLHLTGLISEVNRCFYYENGKAPADLTASMIAGLAGFQNNEVAEHGFARWLEECPSDLPINILDLLYWEHRLGVWSASGLSFREAIIDQVPPMNCRRFLELGLSTDVSDRKAPHALIREIIGYARPELLNYDFNWDWMDSWHRFRRNRLPLPWRAKRLLGWTD